MIFSADNLQPSAVLEETRSEKRTPLDKDFRRSRQMMSDLISHLDHPLLGVVTGRRNAHTVQFLGIRYGNLRHRFSASAVCDGNKIDGIDATRYGAPVIFRPESCDMEMAFIQQSLDKNELPAPSDLNGLNLNITLPLISNQLPHIAARLPVLVYVHGGGFTFGSSGYPHYDQSRIVAIARRSHQPVIAVNINYRLGVPGFLTSKELRELGGFDANNGLRDQQTAFRWIKKYIAGFGGDPEAITAIGQSAGAASLTFHLQSQEPFFDQCILLGGTFLMMRPSDLDSAEIVYHEIIKELALDNLGPSDRIQALTNIAPSNLLQKVKPTMLLGPVVDHDLIPRVADFSTIQDGSLSLPGRSWCRRLMTFDSGFDGSIFALVNLNSRENGIRRGFQDSIRSNQRLNAISLVEPLLEIYNIKDSTSDHDALMAIILFFTDILFYAPSVAMAKRWERSYVCHFNEENPWEGIYTGQASHMLDIAYLWQNYNHKLTAPQQAVAKTLAENVIAFSAGQEPVPPFNLEQCVGVYGPSSRGATFGACQLDDGKETKRRAGFFTSATQIVGGLDALLDAALAFLMS